MTVAELRKALEELPDDALVVQENDNRPILTVISSFRTSRMAPSNFGDDTYFETTNENGALAIVLN